MKIGLLADIHGNWPALDAVLDDMESVDSIVCAGDVIGYNPFPKACLDRIREIADVTVQGNHDRAIESPDEAPFNNMAIEGLKYARSEIFGEDLQWLIDLPE